MKKRIFSIVLILLLILASAVPGNALVNAENEGKSKIEIIKGFEDKSNGKLKYYENDEKIFVGGVLSDKRKADAEDAMNFLMENQALLNNVDVHRNFKTDELIRDENGHTFITFNQEINGIKVLDSKLNVHYNKDGVIVSINGSYESDQELANEGRKSITAKDAVNTAKSLFDYDSLGFEPRAEKVIFEQDGNLYAAYKVNIYYFGKEIGNWDVFVDLYSGEVLEVLDNIRYDGPVEGSGINVQEITVPLNLYLSGSTYYMRDVTKLYPSEILTYTMNNSTTTGYLISNSEPKFTNEKAGVSAHYGAGAVYDFYKELFGRNSIDSRGMLMRSFVHYGYNYNNAFWDGYEMVYGDGDGTNFTYFSGDLDVVGHEMTHGVTDYEADLVYKNQPGALNESMSDVFGVLIQTYDKAGGNKSLWNELDAADWVVGDQIITPNIPGDALRSLADPTLYDQPDHMDDYYVTTTDYGGVHTNSGIPNKAAFLIAESIGLEKTARIYYKALTDIMSSRTDFEQAYLCLREAAATLGYGDDVSNAIDYAFNAVGIVNISPPVIIPVTGVSVYPKTLEVEAGSTAKLTETVYPADASIKTVTWYSSATTVADVDSSGTVAAKSEGMAVITVKTDDGSFTDTCIVTVTAPVGSSIVVEPSSITLKVRETTILSATVVPAGLKVTWTSSNTKVATVDKSGKVTAKSKGAAVITAALPDGTYDTCNVTVYK